MLRISKRFPPLRAVAGSAPALLCSVLAMGLEKKEWVKNFGFEEVGGERTNGHEM
jgi:hypothetical protein